MDQNFAVATEERAGIPVVRAFGEIDVASAPILREQLEAALEGGASTVIVDLLDVTFLDSTGLGVLVGAMSGCQGRNGTLRLVVGERRILKVLEITGLRAVFPLFSTLEEALAG